MTTANKTPPGADPKQLERTGTVREIGSQAVWSLSSCKPGFGVDQLRDDNLETYWQSDGSQPHLVNIQFRRKTTVKTLCIYADYKSDESYTPSKISVRVGNNFHNLQEIRQLELVEPSGWIHVPLTDTHKKPIRTFMIQIAVLANHQNGRDTHMRQIKVSLAGAAGMGFTDNKPGDLSLKKNSRLSQMLAQGGINPSAGISTNARWPWLTQHTLAMLDKSGLTVHEHLKKMNLSMMLEIQLSLLRLEDDCTFRIEFPPDQLRGTYGPPVIVELQLPSSLTNTTNSGW